MCCTTHAVLQVGRPVVAVRCCAGGFPYSAPAPYYTWFMVASARFHCIIVVHCMQVTARSPPPHSGCVRSLGWSGEPPLSCTGGMYVPLVGCGGAAHVGLLPRAAADAARPHMFLSSAELCTSFKPLLRPVTRPLPRCSPRLRSRVHVCAASKHLPACLPRPERLDAIAMVEVATFNIQNEVLRLFTCLETKSSDRLRVFT